MIFVTGDTHGDWMGRLNVDDFPEQREMDRNDYVIICGDFGIWHDTNQERHNLKWLDDKPFTTLFVDGNHENFDRLYTMPVSEWNGGNVHFIRPHIIHLMRGQVFKIDGVSLFTFGGARSHDIQDGILEKDDPRIKEWSKNPFKMFRVNHSSWWKEELPSEKEMNDGIQNLEKYNNKIDFIITHCGATSSIALYSICDYKHDNLTNYFE